MGAVYLIHGFLDGKLRRFFFALWPFFDSTTDVLSRGYMSRNLAVLSDPCWFRSDLVLGPLLLTTLHCVVFPLPRLRIPNWHC